MNWAAFNLTDWAILAAMLAFVISAIIAGFFQEAFGIAGLVCGYLLAAWQYQHVAVWLGRFVKADWVAEIVAFLAIFIAVMVVAGIAGRMAHWVMKKAGLSTLDRVLGGFLGLLRGGLTVAIVLVAMAAFTPSSQWLEGSQLAPYFLVVGRAATWVAPPDLRARFYQGLDLLRHQAEKVESGEHAASRK
jgi:membrane protein required for colicin V production